MHTGNTTRSDNSGQDMSETEVCMLLQVHSTCSIFTRLTLLCAVIPSFTDQKLFYSN